MKTLNSICSVFLGLVAMYLMITSDTTLLFGAGFACLLMAIIFMNFVIMDEQKQEIERLRRHILKGIMKDG